MLTFQKLDAYRCAIELVALTVQIQAAIAEGSGRATEADAARHFAIARGSAMECAG